MYNHTLIVFIVATIGCALGLTPIYMQACIFTMVFCFWWGYFWANPELRVGVGYFSVVARFYFSCIMIGCMLIESILMRLI